MSTVSYVKSFPEFSQDTRPVASVFYSGSTLEDSRIVFTSGTYIYQIKNLQELANTAKPQLSAELIFDGTGLFGDNKINQSTYKIVQSGSNLYFFGSYKNLTDVYYPNRLGFSLNMNTYQVKDITPHHSPSYLNASSVYDAIVYGDHVYVAGNFQGVNTEFYPEIFARFNARDDAPLDINGVPFWENPLSGSGSLTGPVNAILKVHDNKILLGGEFNYFSSSLLLNKLAYYDTVTTELTRAAGDRIFTNNFQKMFFTGLDVTPYFLYLYSDGASPNFYSLQTITNTITTLNSVPGFDPVILSSQPYNVITLPGNIEFIHINKNFNTSIYRYDELPDFSTTSRIISGLSPKRDSSSTTWFISSATSLYPHLPEVVFFYGHFEVENEFNKSTNLAFYVSGSFIYVQNRPPRDYTIVRYETVNEEYDKNTDQIPFNLNVPGPVSLRGKNKPYTLKIG